MICQLKYVSGYRDGQPCPYRATQIIYVPGLDPGLSCGYHARAWRANVRYPLWANLATLRRLQMANLDALRPKESQ